MPSATSSTVTSTEDAAAPALLAAWTTVPDAATAQRIAQAAVAQGLAACVQQDSIHSTYQWQGAVQSEPELRLLFKTTQTAWPALQALIAQLHPYELPALYAWPITHSSPAYAQWVANAMLPKPPAKNA